MPEALLVIFLVLLVLGFVSQRATKAGKPASSEREGSRDDGGDEVAVVAIEDAIDLHGFRPREITSVVESYLEAAAERGFEEVRLIHGRGKGVQRRRVRSLLSKHPLVEHYADAPAHRGGWGAQLVVLKKRP